MWCASARRQSQLPCCPITVAGASVEPVIVVRDLGVYIDGDLAPPPMYVEQCRAVSPYCDNFVIYVATSPTTAFVLSWSRLSTPAWIMATSCVLDFLPIFSDVCRPYSTLQLAWYSNFVAMTMCLTHSRYCTDCVCQRVNFKLALMSNRVLNGMALPYLNQLVPVSSLPGRRRLQSSFTLQLHVPQYRLSTAGRRSFPVTASIFWNTLPDDEQSAVQQFTLF